MPEWLIAMLVGSVGVGLFARLIPKKKLSAKLVPPCVVFGKALSGILTSRLGKKSAEKIEEGVVITFVHVFIECLGAFEMGLLSDNKEGHK